MSNEFSDLKVLIVEDQDDARAELRDMLVELGVAEVFEAGNGTEAMNFIDTAFDFINLVVCDWNMPEMSGVDFLREIRSIDRSLPFLMVTGRSDVESVTAAKKHGVTAYIRKPISSKQLEAKLRVILYKMAA